MFGNFLKSLKLKRHHLFLPVLGVAYVLSQFLRSSNAVIAPELTTEMSLLPSDIGMLTGAFFLVFALVQVPIGVFLDRVGPRVVMSFLLVFAAVGCVAYALANDFWGLSIGRGLMGLGCASILMGSYVIFARWFPSEKFSSYAATLVTIGNLGILLATLPLSAAVEGVGWRTVFNWTAGITLIAAMLVFVVIKDDPETSNTTGRKDGTLYDSFMQLGVILKNKTFWTFVPLMLMGYSSVATIITLWSGPYLEQIMGLSTIERGEILLLMAIGAVLGPIILGHLDRVFDTRKLVVAVGAGFSIILFLTLGLLPKFGTGSIGFVFFLLAMTPGYLSVFMAHARAIYPDHLVGRGMTLANVANMGGVALLQVVTGYILQLVIARTGDVNFAYSAVFIFLGVVLFLALMVYLRSDDIRPSEQRIADEENKPLV